MIIKNPVNFILGILCFICFVVNIINRRDISVIIFSAFAAVTNIIVGLGLFG